MGRGLERRGAGSGRGWRAMNQGERPLPQPRRGELWLVDFDPTQGHEQAGRRPALIVSTDGYNLGPARMAVAVPLTSTARAMPMRVRVEPPEARLPSDILCDQVRAIAYDRLVHRVGQVTPVTLVKVEGALRILLGL